MRKASTFLLTPILKAGVNLSADSTESEPGNWLGVDWGLLEGGFAKKGTTTITQGLFAIVVSLLKGPIGAIRSV